MIVDVLVQTTKRFEFKVYRDPQRPEKIWASAEEGYYSINIGPAKDVEELRILTEGWLQRHLNEYGRPYCSLLNGAHFAVEAFAGNIPVDPPVKDDTNAQI